MFYLPVRVPFDKVHIGKQIDSNGTVAFLSDSEVSEACQLLNAKTNLGERSEPPTALLGEAATEKTANELYHELIYAVEKKFPDETRHQTALRYIMEAESNSIIGSERAAKTDAV